MTQLQSRSEYNRCFVPEMSKYQDIYFSISHNLDLMVVSFELLCFIERGTHPDLVFCGDTLVGAGLEN